MRSTTPVQYLLLPTLLAPFAKPPEPAIRHISLCHPWNVGDNYHLSSDPRPLSSHRHSVDPTVYIDFKEGKVEVKGTEKQRGLDHVLTIRLFTL